jgi:hypothetical protein
VTAIGQIAFRTGVAVYDPQRELVALPAPFAEGPMTAEGVQPHIDMAENAFAAVARGAAVAAGEDDDTVRRSIDSELVGAGFRTTSPLGFEITPDIADEVAADPLRMPTSLQTPDRKAELIEQLAAPTVGDRHRALIQLAAWDEDAEVASALRPMLASDDVFEASQAATGLARQGDISDLPAMVALVHRMSPADGATLEAMIAVLPPALELARAAGPVAIDGLKARAREWRGDPPRRGQPWQVDFYQAIGDLLDEA